MQKIDHMMTYVSQLSWHFEIGKKVHLKRKHLTTAKVNALLIVVLNTVPLYQSSVLKLCINNFSEPNLFTKALYHWNKIVQSLFFSNWITWKLCNNKFSVLIYQISLPKFYKQYRAFFAKALYNWKRNSTELLFLTELHESSVTIFLYQISLLALYHWKKIVQISFFQTELHESSVTIFQIYLPKFCKQYRAFFAKALYN